MIIASAAGSGYAGVQCGPRLVGASVLGQELAVLKVRGDVIGMRAKESLELLVRGAGIAGISALHRQAVTREGIIGFGGDEFFQHLAACLLVWLGHGLEPRIIVALRPNAKSLGGTDTPARPARMFAWAHGAGRIASYWNSL